MANHILASSKPIDRPLLLVLALTFLASVGTGAVTNGIFFLTESAMGYGKTRNFLVALLMGVAYIAGAIGVGPALRRLTATTRLTTRTVTVTILLTLGLVCTLPVAAAGGTTKAPPDWSIWTLVLIFGVLTGAFWPIVEGYLSGGRRDKKLRSAIGWFNITWAAAVILAMWIISPFVEHQPMTVLLWVGLAHALAAPLLLPLAPEPPKHLDDSPHPVPAHFRDLLRVTRILLPASYVLVSSLGPAIPAVLGQLGVAITWKAPVFSTWLIARLFMFIALERWHGWHGRWGLPLLGGIGMMFGFALAMLAPRFGSLGLPALFAGLTIFGLSVAMVYVSSLYYGMETGGANVDDGGRHEAFIGLGYAGGPAFGLLAAAIVGPTSAIVDLAVVALVAPVAATCCLTGIGIGLRARRRTSE